jgi:outer membrane protein TolC
MNTLKIGLVGLAIFFNASLFSQEGLILSLQEAQDYAIKNNYQVQKAAMDVNIAKKKVFETTAIGLPQVNAEGTIQRFLDIPVNLAPANSFDPLAPEDQLIALQFGLNYSNSVGISASQLLFDGSYIVGLQAAKTYREVSEHSLEKTEIDLKENVKQAYFTVLVAQENHDVLTQSLTSTKSMLKETEALYEAGLIEEQNVEQLTLTVNELKVSTGIAKGQVRFAKKLLLLQLGMNIDTSVTLKDDINFFVEGVNLEAIEKEFKLENHIDYTLSMNNARLMQLNLRKEKYSFLPSLSAFFSHQQQNMSNNFDVFTDGRWFPSTVVGAKLTLPILSSGMRLAKMGQAKLEWDKSKVDLEMAEQNLRYQSQLAKSNYQTAYEAYINSKDNLELAEKIYNKTVKKYQEGLVSSMELAQAQNQLLSTEGKYIQSLLDVLKSQSELQKSFGSNN